MFHAHFSDSESVVPDVSDTASSSSTNEIGLEKRRLGAFTNIGEEINPSENVRFGYRFEAIF